VYVCVCHAVTDSQVRQAVHNGVTLMRELREELNVASSCGRCACCARDILRATLKEIGEREDFAQAA
jgi:bacterioferritin-associated ferredoxin